MVPYYNGTPLYGDTDIRYSSVCPDELKAHLFSLILKEQCPGVLTQNFYKRRKFSLYLWKNDFKNSS